MASALAPDSPQATAAIFARAILIAGELDGAWPALDEPLRRELADAWVQANADHAAVRCLGSERVIDPLVAGETGHPLWPHFAAATVAFFRERWAAVDLQTWGWSTSPRLVSVDEEIVLLANRAAAVDVDEQTVECPTVAFMLRLAHDGWWITGILESQPAAAPS